MPGQPVGDAELISPLAWFDSMGIHHIALSSNGRTAPPEGVDTGSTPVRAANRRQPSLSYVSLRWHSRG
jgi:hypothetical protein